MRQGYWLPRGSRPQRTKPHGGLECQGCMHPSINLKAQWPPFCIQRLSGSTTSSVELGARREGKVPLWMRLVMRETDA
jgi:hypothetical protein